jgi:cell division protein FtsZ
MFEISNTTGELEIQEGAKIKVIGVGGGGCNAVNTMIKSGLTGVEYVVANTDLQALGASLAPTKIQLGLDRTKGLGAGANPEVGKQAALSEETKLKEILEGADLVFITAGMGGGTGTGAAPVISKLSKELGALTVGVVTKPFVFEGKKRTRQALAGIEDLESGVDSLITIPNQRLLQLAGENLSLIETFKKADEVLLNAVKGISDLINNTGHINADFADVATVMANKGLSLMGTGLSSGEGRAIKAAKEAISSPLLEDISIDGATGIIINISGNESLTMHETNEAVTLIMEAADEDAEIIFGTVIDEKLEDQVKVTVIATGLGGMERVSTKNIMLPKKETILEETLSNSICDESVALEEVVTVSKNREERVQVVEDSIEKIEVVIEEEAPVAEKRILQDGLDKIAEETRNRAREINEERNDERIERSSVNDSYRPSRAKTIAEKLGFVSYDEEELDTPSFLRSDSKDSSSSHLN